MCCLLLQELEEYRAEADQLRAAEAMHIAEMSQLSKVPQLSMRDLQW